MEYVPVSGLAISRDEIVTIQRALGSHVTRFYKCSKGTINILKFKKSFDCVQKMNFYVFYASRTFFFGAAIKFMLEIMIAHCSSVPTVILNMYDFVRWLAKKQFSYTLH